MLLVLCPLGCLTNIMKGTNSTRQPVTIMKEACLLLCLELSSSRVIWRSDHCFLDIRRRERCFHEVACVDRLCLGCGRLCRHTCRTFKRRRGITAGAPALYYRDNVTGTLDAYKFLGPRMSVFNTPFPYPPTCLAHPSRPPL